MSTGAPNPEANVRPAAFQPLEVSIIPPDPLTLSHADGAYPARHGSGGLETPTTARTDVMGLTVLTPTSASWTGDLSEDGSGEGLRWRPKARTGSVYSGTSGMVKISRDKQGWGNFPIHLLHLIFSLAQEDIRLPKRLERLTCRDERKYDIVLALLSRVWFCEMRTVCSGWRNAVDSHSFWPSYTLVLEPSRRHESTVDDLYTSSLTPSTPSFPTLFHRARSTTLSTCLACRINHPSRLGLYPANPKRITLTSKLGLAPTCNIHWGNFCSSCMLEQPRLSRDGSNASDYFDRLKCSSVGDTDKLDSTRQLKSMTCMDCRSEAIDFEIERLLVRCARGGRVRGDNNDFQDAAAFTEYVEHGMGTARDAALDSVQQLWLENQTRWPELRYTACEMQRRERALRKKFLLTFQTESDRERSLRHQHIAELRGEDSVIDPWEDEQAMNRMYRAWAKGLFEVEGEGDDEWLSAGDANALDAKHFKLLREGVINDWSMDRVRLGFWITPSQEVQLLVERGDGRFKEIVTFAKETKHCFEPMLPPESTHPLYGAQEWHGLIAIRAGAKNDLPDDPFLPDPGLLEELDLCFIHKLQHRIRPALHQIAHNILEEVGDEEEAERRCAAIDLPTLLKLLGSRTAWIRTLPPHPQHDYPDIRHDQDSGARSPTPSDAGRDSVDSWSSPRVELVSDEEMEEPDYGIEEVSDANDSVSEANGVIEHPAGLGKRKTPPTTSEELGERKAKEGGTSPDQSRGASDQASGHVQAATTERSESPQVSISSTGTAGTPPPNAETESIRSSSETASGPMPITPDEDVQTIALPRDFVKGEVIQTPQMEMETNSPELSASERLSSDSRTAWLPQTGHNEGQGPGVLQHPDVSAAQETENDLSTETSSISSRTASVPASPRPTKVLHTSIDLIPYVPDHQLLSLDPVMVEALMHAWWEARARWRECKCRICLRAMMKRRRERYSDVSSRDEGEIPSVAMAAQLQEALWNVVVVAAGEEAQGD